MLEDGICPVITQPHDRSRFPINAPEYDQGKIQATTVWSHVDKACLPVIFRQNFNPAFDARKCRFQNFNSDICGQRIAWRIFFVNGIFSIEDGWSALGLLSRVVTDTGSLRLCRYFQRGIDLAGTGQNTRSARRHSKSASERIVPNDPCFVPTVRRA